MELGYAIMWVIERRKLAAIGACAFVFVLIIFCVVNAFPLWVSPAAADAAKAGVNALMTGLVGSALVGVTIILGLRPTAKMTQCRSHVDSAWTAQSATDLDTLLGSLQSFDL